MMTIVEPKQYIDQLWGKQRIREEQTYRLMKYVLRVDFEGKVLLHNVVTGQLALLETTEAHMLDRLPKAYEPLMSRLVLEHYLVPVEYDEHQQVMKLRTVLRRLYDQKSKALTHYVILPTTGCNARCYYCFEQGIKSVTMSETVANNVVGFISEHCGEEREVYISWFGGEPTIAHHRIDQISHGLREKGITYSSMMVTNGLLLNDEMVNRAKTLWNLTSVQITVDGVESNHNRIKAFMDPTENPYQRVLDNVQILLSKDINVTLRMNFDIENFGDFSLLLQEVEERYRHNPRLSVSAHPILGEHPDFKGIVHHGDLNWLRKMNCELNCLSRKAGLANTVFHLPHLEFRGCSADRDVSIAIRPDGGLCCCMEQFGDDQIVGDVETGITNEKLLCSWKEIDDCKQCQVCALFPKCVTMAKCGGAGRCFGNEELIYQSTQAMCNAYQHFIKEGLAYDVQRTVGGVCFN